MEFRAGRPDDYVTMSVGYSYYDFSQTPYEPSLVVIKNYFDTLQLEPEVKKTVLMTLASLLDGHNKRPGIDIWYGQFLGDSKELLDLIKQTFGDYYSSLPSAMVKRKGRSVNKSVNANWPSFFDFFKKRVVVVVEDDNNSNYDYVDIPTLRELTTGDYVSPYGYKPQAKVIVTLDNCSDTKAIDMLKNQINIFARENVVNWNKQNNGQDLHEKDIETSQAFIWWLLKEIYPQYRALKGKSGFDWCCSSGNLNLAKELHKIYDDIHANKDSAFITSCRYGQIEVIKWLLSLDKFPNDLVVKNVPLELIDYVFQQGYQPDADGFTLPLYLEYRQRLLKAIQEKKTSGPTTLFEIKNLTQMICDYL
jgi:hypothetical protein